MEADLSIGLLRWYLNKWIGTGVIFSKPTGLVTCERIFSKKRVWMRKPLRTAAPQRASPVLEVGCGTGAILSELPNYISRHGLDIDPAALAQCQSPCANGVILVQGNALELPYPNEIFDIVYCHFLLLWVADPLQALLEMKRVTKKGGRLSRLQSQITRHAVDQPRELVPLGEWQTEALQRQGADPGLGARWQIYFLELGSRSLKREQFKMHMSGSVP